MSEGHVPFDETAQPNQLAEQSANSAPESVVDDNAESTPQNPEGWLEPLRNINYRDHIGAIATIGGAALALGVGVYELRKHRKSISIDFADRRYKDDGVISIVEKTEKGGFALGAAISRAALLALKKDDKHAEKKKMVFGMKDGKVVHPLESDAEAGKIAEHVREAAGYLIEAISDPASKKVKQEKRPTIFSRRTKKSRKRS